MNQNDINARLLNIVALATDYCGALEHAREIDKQMDFIIEILGYLPRLYWEFSDMVVEDVTSDLDYDYYPSYVDEDFYDSVRRNVEAVMGEDDVFLETFEEDMKYSDTPIAASISECLADIFQPLYNFISIVRESNGEQIMGAYSECRENFVSYWAQTLCNVLRALNNIRFK